MTEPMPGDEPAVRPAPPAPGTRVIIAPGGTVISSRARRFGGYLLTIVLLVVTLWIGYVIWALIVWNRGQTPAKQLLGMYVVDVETGLPATWGKMFVRGFLVDVLLGSLTGGLFNFVSALWIFSNPENQRLTDRIVSTIVVDDPAAILRSRLRT